MDSAFLLSENTISVLFFGLFFNVYGEVHNNRMWWCVVKLTYRICERRLPHTATVFCGKLMRWREKQHCHFLWSIWKDTTFLYALLFISIQRDQVYVLLHPVIAVLLNGWKQGLNCIASYAGIINSNLSVLSSSWGSKLHFCNYFWYQFQLQSNICFGNTRG